MVGNIALRNSRPAIRNAYVVDERVDFIGWDDSADFALESSKPGLCLFNAGAGGAASMKAHLSGIHIREKVFTHQPDQT